MAPGSGSTDEEVQGKLHLFTHLIVSALKLRDLTFEADKFFCVHLNKFDLETLYSPKGSRYKAHVKKIFKNENAVLKTVDVSSAAQCYCINVH